MDLTSRPIAILVDCSPNTATVQALHPTGEQVDASGDQHLIAYVPAGTQPGERVWLDTCEVIGDPHACEDIDWSGIDWCDCTAPALVDGECMVCSLPVQCVTCAAHGTDSRGVHEIPQDSGRAYVCDHCHEQGAPDSE